MLRHIIRSVVTSALAPLVFSLAAQYTTPVPIEQPAWTQVFQSVDGSPLSLGDTLSVQFSPISGELYSQALLDMLAIRKDRTSTLKVPDMDIRLTLNVYAKKHEDYESYAPNEQYDSLLVVILELGYRNGTSLVPGLDLDLDKVSDGEFLTKNIHLIRSIVQNIEVNTGNGYLPVNDVPQGVQLEMEVEWLRLPSMDLSHPPLLNSPTETGCTYTQPVLQGNPPDPLETHELLISWGYVTGAVEYHLEWAYVDNYKANNPALELPNTALKFDFDRDATRIVTDRNSYRLPLIFDRGWIVWRVRAVGRDPDAPTLPLYGIWTRDNPIGSVSEMTGANLHITEDLKHNPSKNWQLTSTYAEEGKTKEVMVYADGTSRQRQTVARNNSLYVPVIGQTFYDAVGRAAVEVMPVPMIKDKGCPPLPNGNNWAPIDYYNGFNQAEATPPHPFTYLDLAAVGTECTPLAEKLDEGDGAELYYHPNSLLLANPLFDQNSYVPKAGGYPYVQTEYMPDNTGRVKRKGGVGIQHQLGAHATRFMYGTPEQVKLDRLFGSEAPYATQCQKNITVDANGQATATYLDGSGRTIATALVGTPTAEMNPLISVQTQVLQEDLFNGQLSTDCDQNHLDLLAGTLTFQDVLVLPQNNMVVRMDYGLTIPHFSDPCLTQICYHCVYDLSIRITDAECGQVVHDRSGLIGQFDAVNDTVFFGLSDSQACLNEPSVSWPLGPHANTGEFSVADQFFDVDPLLAGTYIVTKTLSVHQNAMEDYAVDYANGVHLLSTCFASLQDLTDSIMATVDTSDCSITCAECAAALGPLDIYVMAGGLAETWQDIYNDCTEPCREESWCTVAYGNMISDVRPGGQYAKYSLDANQNVVVTDPTSLFHLVAANSRLTQRLGNDFVDNTALWQQPRTYHDDGTFESAYLDENGERTRIPLVTYQESPPYNYLSFTTLLYPGTFPEQDDLGNWYAYPEELARVEDFLIHYINHPEWARSLVYLHPEYGYYIDCKKYGQLQASGQTMTSDSWDSQLRSTTTGSYLDVLNEVNSVWVSYGASPAEKRKRTALYFESGPGGNPLPLGGGLSWQLPDPFLRYPVGADWINAAEELKGKYDEYLPNPAVPTTFLSMPEFAAIMARCGGIYTQMTPPAVAACADFANQAGMLATDTLLASEWKILVTIYLGEKYRIQKRWADRAVTMAAGGPARGANHCIGEESHQEWKDFLKHEPVYSDIGPGPVTGTAAFYATTAGASLHAGVCTQSNAWYWLEKVRRVAEPVPAQNSANPDLSAFQVYQQTGQCPMAVAWSGVFQQLATIDRLGTGTTPIDLFDMASYGAILLSQSNFQPDPPLGSAMWSTTVATNGTVTATIVYDHDAGGEPCPAPECDCAITLDPPDNFIWENIVQVLQLNALNDQGSFTLVVGYVDGNGDISSQEIAGHMCDELFDLYTCSFSETCNANEVGEAFQEFLNTYVNDLPNLLSVAELASIQDEPTTTPLLGIHAVFALPFLISPPVIEFSELVVNDPVDALLSFEFKDVGTHAYPYDQPAWEDRRLRITIDTILDASGVLQIISYLDGISSYTNLRSEGDNTYVVDLISTGQLPAGTVRGRAYFKNWMLSADFNPYPLGTCNFPPPPACSDAVYQLPLDLANVVRERLLLGAGVGATFDETIDLFASPNMTPLLQNALGPLACSTCTAPDYHVTSVTTHNGNGTDHTITFTMDPLVVPECILTVLVHFNSATTVFNDVDDFVVDGIADGDGFYHQVTGQLMVIGEAASIGTVTIVASCIDMKPCEACEGTTSPYAGLVLPEDFIPPEHCHQRWLDWRAWAIAYNACPYALCHAFHLEYTDISYELFRALNLCSCLNTLPDPQAVYDANDPAVMLCDSEPLTPTAPQVQNLAPTPCLFPLDPDDPCVLAYADYLAALDQFDNAINYPQLSGAQQLSTMSIGTFLNGGYCYCSTSYNAALLDHLVIVNGELTITGIEAYFDLHLQSLFRFCEPHVPCTNPIVIQNEVANPDTIDPCVQDLLQQAALAIEHAYDVQQSTLTENFQAAYTSQCLQALETFSMQYHDPEHHYTLYYYDQAGNLVRTVPPEGVEQLGVGIPGDPQSAVLQSIITADRLNGTHSVFTSHRLSSEYTFNSLNNPVRQLMPDQDPMSTWETALPAGIPPDLKITSSQFTGAGTGFLSGRRTQGIFNRGYVFRTADAGNTWHRSFGLVAANLKNLTFFDGTVGYAVGKYGTFLYTSDGGSSWDQQWSTLSSMGTDLNDVYALPATAGAGILVGASGTAGLLQKFTANGGTYTTPITTAGFGPLQAISGWSTNLVTVGYDVQDPDKRSGLWGTSANSGTTWTLSNTTNGFGGTSADITCACPTTSITSSMAYVGGTCGVLLKHTNTAALSTVQWKTVLTHTVDDFVALWFMNDQDGIALMDSSNGQRVLRYTSDGGEHWSTFFAEGRLNAIYGYKTTSPGALFAVGNAGQLVQVFKNVGDPAGFVPRDPVGSDDLTAIAGVLNTGLKVLIGQANGHIRYTPDLLAPVPTWTLVQDVVAGLPGKPIKNILMNAFSTTQFNFVLTGGDYVAGNNLRSGKWVLPSTFTMNAVQSVSAAKCYQVGTMANGTAWLYNKGNVRADKLVLNLAAVAATPTALASNNGVPPPTAAPKPDMRAMFPATAGTTIVLGGPPPSSTVAANLYHMTYTSTTITWVNRSNYLQPLPLFDLVDGLTDGSSLACGAQGTFFQRTTTTAPWRAFPTKHLKDLHGVAKSGSTIVAVGDNGSIISGTSLTPTGFADVISPTEINFHDVLFKGTSLTIAGDDGKAVYTPNFALLSTNPFQVLLPTTNVGHLQGLALQPSSNEIFTVGEHALVHRFQGAARMAVQEIFPRQLNDVHFGEANEGYVVGNDLTVRHTIDGGDTWDVVPVTGITGTPLKLNAVFTFDSGKAFVAGTNGIFRSITGNTLDVPLPATTVATTIFNDVVVERTSGSALLVGENGTAGKYLTRNAGTTTWSAEQSIANRKLYAGFAWPRYFRAVNTPPGNLGYSDDFAVGGSGGTLTVFRYKATGSLWTLQATTGVGTGDVKALWFHDRISGLAASTSGALYRISCPLSNIDHLNAFDAPAAVLGYPDQLNTQTSAANTKLTTIAFSDRTHGFMGGDYTVAPVGYARTINDDGGLQSQRMWYDRLGRLALSQNIKQFDPDPNSTTEPKNFSYTRYDALGRPVQAGQVTALASACAAVFGADVNGEFNPAVIDDAELSAFLDGNLCTEVVSTQYDLVMSGNTVPFTQDNLRLRVATTTYQDASDNNPSTPTIDNDPLTYEHATHYSYDIHGNVKEMAQDIPQMNRDAQGLTSPTSMAQRYKDIRYDYDLISGNVKGVAYQEGKVDQMFHQYQYDADNRILSAQVSTSGQQWRTDARYFYYPHGPLKRTELGNYPAQGVDYAYTLQGWLKNVNSDLLRSRNDMGHDGTGDDPNFTNNPNAWIGKDAYGFSLYYNAGDYDPIDAAVTATADVRAVASDGAPVVGEVSGETKDLFNGNIARWTNTLRPLTTGNGWSADNNDVGNQETGRAMTTVYHYDQLNRLNSARSATGLTRSANSWAGMTLPPSLYRSEYVYDANGNILKAERYDQFSVRYDSLSYFYELNGGKRVRNRLYHLRDNAATTIVDPVADGVADLDDPTPSLFNNASSTINTINNYGYDPLGNLVRDNRENIANILWNVSGKVLQVDRPGGSALNPLKFAYGAHGHRISKSVYVPGSSTLKERYYYIHDAHGNVMATYWFYAPDKFRLIERPLYGSDRLGMDTHFIDSYGVSSIDLGETSPVASGDAELRYELKDHLGNVASVITGDLIGVNWFSQFQYSYKVPKVVGEQGYESFGSLLPGRNYSAAAYRFGFNGMPKDDEVYGSTTIPAPGTSYDFGARMYDSRIGRWFCRDNYAAMYPGFSPYSFAGNNPIKFIDIGGDSIWVTEETHEYGSKIVVTRTIHTTIAVLNASDNTFDIDEAAGQIKSSLIEALQQSETNASGVEFIYRADVSVRGVKEMAEVQKSDHLMVVVDNVTGDDLGGAVVGVSNMRGQIVYVETPAFWIQGVDIGERLTAVLNTFVHEWGHMAGMEHSKDRANVMIKSNPSRTGQQKFDIDQMRQLAGDGGIPNVLNQGDNSVAAPSDQGCDWLPHRATNEQPFDSNVSKGERIPTPVGPPDE